MYQGSEYHKENARKAFEKGREKQQENRKKRIKEYNKNPKRCKSCGKPIPYKQKAVKQFCNKSCSAQYNNTLRGPRSEKTKKAISDSMKVRVTEGRHKAPQCKSCKIQITECKVCGKPFIQRSWGVRKTCSEECIVKAKTSRTYRNGSRKTIYFNNPNQGKIVLESSWELEIAKLLCEKQIKWIRPEPMKWVDSKGKVHLYYPDFYLVDHNLYLDPKNPYCMEKDKEKMSIVEEQIKIEYGSLSKIKEIINKLP